MRFLVALVLCLAVFFDGGIPTAYAEDEPREVEESVSEQAVRLGHEGLRHFSEGRYSEAYTAFGHADALAHSPVFVLYRARALRELGDWLGARELFLSCSREGVGADTPVTWKKALVDCVDELAALKQKLPRLDIRVRGGAFFPIRLELGERTVVLAEAETQVDVNPGPLELVARDVEGTRIARLIYVAPGREGTELLLKFPQVLEHDAQESAPSLGPIGIDHRAPPRPYRSGAHAAFLLGGASLIFGTVSGIVAWSKARQVKRNCVASSCRPEDKEVAQSAINWGNTATAAFVTGAVGVGAGMGLLFWPAGASVRGEF